MLLRQAIGEDRNRLSEAQRVTEWTERCRRLTTWVEERRLAMLAVRQVPSEVEEAEHLLAEHRQIRAQITRRTPDKDDVIG